MASVKIDAARGVAVIEVPLSAAAFRPSSTGKSTLLLDGADTQVMGDAGIRGSVNLYAKDPEQVIARLKA